MNTENMARNPPAWRMRTVPIPMKSMAAPKKRRDSGVRACDSKLMKANILERYSLGNFSDNCVCKGMHVKDAETPKMIGIKRMNR